MTGDDIALCGGKEVDITDYLDTWRNALEENVMRFIRTKTQFMVINTCGTKIYTYIR